MYTQQSVPRLRFPERFGTCFSRMRGMYGGAVYKEDVSMIRLTPSDLTRPKPGCIGKKFATGVLECLPGEIRHCVIVAPQMEWFELHWFNGCHVPCTSVTGHCLPCIHGSPTDSKGFTFVQEEGHERLLLLKFTRRMWSECLDLHNVESLRGVMLKVYKPGKHRCNRTMVQLAGLHPKRHLLPVPPSIEDAVVKLWSKVVPLPPPTTEAASA